LLAKKRLVGPQGFEPWNGGVRNHLTAIEADAKAKGYNLIARQAEASIRMT
jgi:hypothetical protein